MSEIPPPPEPFDVDLSSLPDPLEVRRSVEDAPVAPARPDPPRPALDRYRLQTPTGKPQTVRQYHSHRRYTMTRALRPALLGILSLLSLTGLLPPEVKTVIEANVDAVLGGLLAAWAIIGAYRNYSDKKEAAQ